MTLDEAIAQCPVVAIIRGVTPDEAVAVAEDFYRAGIRAVETPLNSPDPLESIRRISEAFEGRMVCGAGTVLAARDVDAVAQSGGRLVVSPNTQPAVIARAVELGLDPAPGFATPTEAFAAIEAGARQLKLFPASTYGPQHLKQLLDVLPKHVVVWAVGGVGPEEMAAWWAAGARAFGLGSFLYRPGRPSVERYERAVQAVKAAAALSQG